MENCTRTSEVPNVCVFDDLYPNTEYSAYVTVCWKGTAKCSDTSGPIAVKTWAGGTFYLNIKFTKHWLKGATTATKADTHLFFFPFLFWFGR